LFLRTQSPYATDERTCRSRRFISPYLATDYYTLGRDLRLRNSGFALIWEFLAAGRAKGEYDGRLR
jgi:hypothetical protein